MSNQYVVTFIGDDRTGIVEQLAALIEQHGGNWLESQLSQLQGKFAGLILIALTDDNADALQAALAKLPGELSASVTPAGVTVNTSTPNLTLIVVGPDRPGIIKEISAALAEAHINVIALDSHLDSAPFTGEPLFRATVSVHVPEAASEAALEARLEQIAEALTLDIDLNR